MNTTIQRTIIEKWILWALYLVSFLYSMNQILNADFSSKWAIEYWIGWGMYILMIGILVTSKNIFSFFKNLARGVLVAQLILLLPDIYKDFVLHPSGETYVFAVPFYAVCFLAVFLINWIIRRKESKHQADEQNIPLVVIATFIAVIAYRYLSIHLIGILS